MASDNENLNNRRLQREKLRQQRLARQRRTIAGLIAAGVVLLLCGVLIFAMTRGKNSEKPAENTSVKATQSTVATSSTATSETEPAPPRETVIHIAAAGDFNVTDKTVAAGYRNGTYDYTEVFKDVLPLLADADLTVMNFEGTLCGQPYGGEDASAPQQMVEALRNAGVDLLQAANSCSINNGLQGLSKTLSSIRAAGMEPLGAYADAKEFQKSGGYTIVNVQGIRIAFVAFTKGMDNRGLPEGSEDCVNLLYTDYASNYQQVDTEGITKILRAAAAEEPDFTIAMLHWGSEYNDQISKTQEKIRSLMFSEGVNAIIGTHPHYVQKMVLDPENNTFTAYSLGDFFSDAERSGSNYSVVLNLEITKNEETGITSVTDYRYEPIFTQTGESGMQVVRIKDAITAYEEDYIQRISQSDYEAMTYALERIEDRINAES